MRRDIRRDDPKRAAHSEALLPLLFAVLVRAEIVRDMIAAIHVFSAYGAWSRMIKTHRPLNPNSPRCSARRTQAGHGGTPNHACGSQRSAAMAGRAAVTMIG